MVLNKQLAGFKSLYWIAKLTDKVISIVAQATLDRESQLVPDSLENYTRQEP
jgi:hypothetical protein